MADNTQAKAPIGTHDGDLRIYTGDHKSTRARIASGDAPCILPNALDIRAIAKKHREFIVDVHPPKIPLREPVLRALIEAVASGCIVHLCYGS